MSLLSIQGRPTILVFRATYVPGFKGGGPTRTIVNLVEHIGDGFEFRIVTSDRDTGDVEPYSAIPRCTWLPVGKALVWYQPPRERGFQSPKRLWFGFGSLDNTEVPRLLSSHDLLVLPCSYDGRGAVVNEALGFGTPAVASDACGASDVLVNHRIGDVFRSGDLRALRETLERRITAGPIGADDRRARVEWASSAISPSAGARYLVSLIEGKVDTLPPWDAIEATW